MFALIITIVSIALVIALALATIYYGGSASNTASAKAAAATLISQSAQIAAAGVLSTSQGVAWPTTAPHFAEPYLKAMPVPPRSAYVDEVPAPTDWQYYMTGSTHFMLENKISKSVCMAVNRTQGLIGIPAAWDGKSLIQCFGRGVANPKGELAYTFFYDPPGTTGPQKAAAGDKSVADANTGSPAEPATPGYPRLCPDGSTIDTGLCIDPTGSGSQSGTSGPGGPGGSGGGVGGGGGGSLSLSCNPATYTDKSMSATCTVKNNIANPAIITSIYGYSQYDNQAPLPMGSGCMTGEPMAPGASCSFQYTASWTMVADGPPALFVDHTYGATGTEGSSRAQFSSFVYQATAPEPTAGPFMRDTFTGAGTLASHSGEIGANWSFMWSVGATLDNYGLDNGFLTNVDGYNGYLMPSGAPPADSNGNYYIEMDVRLPSSFTGSDTWLDLRTEGGFELYWYLNTTVDVELDGSMNGSGLGYVEYPAMKKDTLYKYRIEYTNGAIFVYLNGTQIADFYGSSVKPGKFFFSPGWGLTVDRVEAGLTCPSCTSM